MRESVIQEAGISRHATKSNFLEMYGTLRNQSEFFELI